MRTCLILLFFLFGYLGNAQSFEGILKYDVQYQLDSVTLKKWNFSTSFTNSFYQPDRYSKSITIYFGPEGYVRNGYEKSEEKLIYKSESQTLYKFFESPNLKKYQRVELIDVRTRYETMETTSGNRMKPKIEVSDSTRSINGIVCSLVMLDFGKFGREEYWYQSDTLKVDPTAYEAHNYEYLNKVLEVTSALPIEVKKSTANYGQLILTLNEVQRQTLDPDLFEIPPLRELKDKTAREFMESLGRTYMETKVRKK